MSTSTEFEIKVSREKNKLPKDLPNGIYGRVMEVETPNHCERFVRIPASELSLEDKWFESHSPKTEEEKIFKKLIKTAIQKGLEDFWRPDCDPSFNKEGNGICYMHGSKLAAGKSYNWWEETAKKFKPDCKSHLGTKSEYIAFLAVLIKELVESGWSIEKAWDAVCNDSKELGHYWNSENAKHTSEGTGCREICGFYDLANVYKILAKDEDSGSFWLVGGLYRYKSNLSPLANLVHSEDPYYDYCIATGWLVLKRTD